MQLAAKFRSGTKGVYLAYFFIDGIIKSAGCFSNRFVRRSRAGVFTPAGNAFYSLRLIYLL